ncbi:MAG: hypothetical protein CTY15_02420 [Methylocystis sp.]|nr:MAG: hypothetical protein CTY15_02420 [Methylocystis sp.]
MIRRAVIASLALAVALVLAPSASFAASEHVTQAILETEEAIKEGKANNASSFAEHAHNALDHAQAEAGDAKPTGHLKSAITHLRQGIKTAKRTHHESRIARGVHHAEQALTDLRAMQ